MQHVFMDESGDLGFGVGSDCLILAFIAPSSGKELNKVMKNFNGHLIGNGWNKNVEIKATNLWHAPKNAGVLRAAQGWRGLCPTGLDQSVRHPARQHSYNRIQLGRNPWQSLQSTRI